MKIPSEITPCPIIEAVMEVRFESTYDSNAVFGIIYKSLIEGDNFQAPIELPILKFPKELRELEVQLKFQPYYRLISKENPNIVFQIGPNVFSVIITNQYDGWSNFLNLIKTSICKLKLSNTVSQVNRVALRYINFFEGNIIESSNIKFLLNGASVASNNLQARLEVPDEEFLSVLSINNNIIRNTNGKIVTGTTIDIDTSHSGVLNKFFDEYEDILIRCHDTEKKLFSSLLSEENIKLFTSIEYNV